MKKKSEFRLSDDPFYNLSRAASATECTGLAPSAVEDDEEGQALGALYAIHPPKGREDKG